MTKTQQIDTYNDSKWEVSCRNYEI